MFGVQEISFHILDKYLTILSTLESSKTTQTSARGCFDGCRIKRRDKPALVHSSAIFLCALPEHLRSKDLDQGLTPPMGTWNGTDPHCMAQGGLLALIPGIEAI